MNDEPEKDWHPDCPVCNGCTCLYVGETPDPREGSHPTYSAVGCPVHRPDTVTGQGWPPMNDAP